SGAGDPQKQQDAREPRGDSEQNQEGIDKRAKLGYQNQVKEGHGQEQSKTKAAEGLPHAFHHAAHYQADAFGEAGSGHDPAYRIGHTTQVFTGRGHVDVDHSLDLIVVHFRGGFEVRHLDHLVEIRRLFRGRRTDGNTFQGEHTVDIAFRILDGEEVVVASTRVDPVARCDHLVGGQRGDDVVHDFLLVEAQFPCTYPVDLELKGRVIDVLWNVDIAHAA